MERDEIRNSFLKVKEDMTFLVNEIIKIKQELENLKLQIRQINPIDHYTANQQTFPQEIEGLKYPILGISTGNEGVQTNKQANLPIDRQMDFPSISKEKSLDLKENNSQIATDYLNSLNNIKKELKDKFKKLTSQEMLVFSSIYQLDELDPGKITYKTLANQLKLSESSIRDYVQKMLQKGIPIKKNKINNKIVLLSISTDLKKIAPLAALIKLREL